MTTKTFNEYQIWTDETAIYDGYTYPRLALAEEVGELLGKLAKFERDVVGKSMSIEDYATAYVKLKNDVKLEAGDVLWQLARVLNDLGITMQEAAEANVDKLESRKQRNVLGGSGDHR